jgi:hypothetical protein
VNLEREWLSKFLASRGLARPDGRALYAYQITNTEFKDLASILKDSISNFSSWNPGSDRLFVCYSAEWWRRDYQGGVWKWADVFDSIGWPHLTPGGRQKIVSEGLNYWKRGLDHHIGGNTAYLMTLVTEGGFPMQLIDHSNSHLSHYLRIILNDYIRYSSAGISAIKISEGHGLKLPPSFRKQPVYQLAADLIETVFDLSKYLDEKVKDPFKELESLYPNWREKLPLFMGDNNARGLINGLLSQASSSKTLKYNRLKIKRFFSDENGTLQHKALIESPSEIPISLLSDELGVSADLLPRSLELVAYIDGSINKVASLTKGSEQYYVYLRSSESLQLSLNFFSDIELRIVEYGGGNLGGLIVSGSDRLREDMPISCYKDNDKYIVIGQGRIRSRFDRIYTSFPVGCLIESGLSFCKELCDINSKGLHDGNNWFVVSGKVVIRLKDGSKYSLATGEILDNNINHVMQGDRLYLYEVKGLPVYSGMPRLFQFDSATHNEVSHSAIYWASSRFTDKWYSLEDKEPYGLVKVRVMQDEESVYSASFTVLPRSFFVKLNPGVDISDGSIFLSGVDGLKASIDIKEVFTSISYSEDGIKIKCKANTHFSGKIPIELIWPDLSRCVIKVPFPSQGVSFINDDGCKIIKPRISLHELPGISVVAASHDNRCRFVIEGRLRSSDISHSIARSLYFTRNIPKIFDGYFTFELADIWQLVNDLFSYSADIDAIVLLELTLNGKPLSRLEVTQFHSQLVFNSTTGQVVHIANDNEPCLDSIDIRLISIFAGDFPEIMHQIISIEDLKGWQLSNITNFTTPSLAIASGSLSRSIRPCLVYSETIKEDDFENKLHQILAISNEKTRRIDLNKLMVKISQDPFDTSWNDVVKSVRACSDAHPDSLDLYKAIIDNPIVAAGLLIRMTKNDLNLLLDLEGFLPFRWWQLPVNSIIEAMKGLKDLSEKQYLDYSKSIMENANAQLREVADTSPIFQTTLDIVFKNIYGENNSGVYAQVEQIGAKFFWEILNNESLQGEDGVYVQIGEREWPYGLERDDWEEVFGEGLTWLNDGEIEHRRALLDSIVSQAHSIVHNKYLSRGHRALICTMHKFIPGNFEEMLSLCISVLQCQDDKINLTS